MTQTKEERLAYKRLYHATHRDTEKSWQRHYDATHKEEKRVSGQLYRKANPEKRRATCKKYRITHQEQERDYRTHYYAAHKKEKAAYHKLHYATHREATLETCRKYALEHREERLAYGRNYARNFRIAVFNHYGHSCKCCGETEPNFLQIDHIDGGGNKHRKLIGRSHLYSWLVKNNYPKGFQVLCTNCNFAKGHYGVCPHQLEKKARATSTARLTGLSVGRKG
jgi:hypothetical protein